MFCLFSRGRKPPPGSHSHKTGSTLTEAKLAAWAIFIGARRPTSDPPARPRRQHRGMLEDLPQPETPELAPLPTIRGIVETAGRLLGFRPVNAASVATLAGDPKTPVGETIPVTYIVRSDAVESNACAPTGADRPNKQDRAA